MADYLSAATPVGQLGILRQAKNPGPNRPIIIQYHHARRTIAECLRDRGGLNRIVAQANALLEDRRDDGTNGPLVRDDAQRCIDVIEAFQRASNALDVWGPEYREARQPSPPLNINGVEVSVAPDALVIDNRRARVGQAFIRCTIGGAGEAAENRRAEANVNLATLAHMHATQYLADLGEPHPQTSMVIDVSRENVFRAPANSARRIANIEAACTMIAAIWPTV
ncbi:hypothetical protein [Tsuneonella dongtanensis]|uniref:hypothetical protein n=1 Tax=Tsuneonella dongtanensis TaxID=692370 RepID=UPI0012ED1BFA|nr:hypothetical protein [Tsuneonella dongtanensis]